MKNDVDSKYVVIILAVGMAENPGGEEVIWWVQYAPLIRKELMYLPKTEVGRFRQACIV